VLEQQQQVLAALATLTMVIATVLWARRLGIANSWTTAAFLLRGPCGSGTIRIDGPAAALITDGEHVSITSWANADRAELATVRARMVAVDRDNRVLEVLDLGLVDDQ